ncbi:MAG: DDE-type integrase/transposase/recombinase [Bauldia sp.]
MKLWLTAREIADEKLPELPASTRGIAKLADRNGWRDRPAQARRRVGAEGGGGWEYHIDLLPAWARLAYFRRHVAIDQPPLQQEAASEPEAEQLSSAAQSARDARLTIAKMADRHHKGSGLSVMAADRLFCDLFNGGSMPVAPWVKAAVGSISPRTIARWRAATRRGALSSLAVDRSAARKGTGILERAEGGAVRSVALAMLAKNPLLTAKHIRALVSDRFGNQLARDAGAETRVPLPPLRTFQHALQGWKHEYRHELTYLTDPDGFKNKVRFVATGATRADRLNEEWQVDASPADVMTSDGRQSIYLCIDVYSRRVSVLVTATPRAEAVGLLIRNCILAWGVPERIKSDNGSDFVAHWTARLIASLGIEHEKAAPFSPEQKGVVERAIGTFQRDCARTLPGFIGHSVADRQRIRAKTAFAKRLGTGDEALFGVDLTVAELQAHVTAWAETIYAHAPHDGLKGATPFQRAAEYVGTVRRIEDAAALAVLLARVPGKDGIRRVTRSGIRIDGTHYLIGSVMPGEDVLCRMDPADLGRLHVFAADGETFLGHAIAPELAGLDPAETISRVRAAQKALMSGRLADIRREAKKIGPRDVAAAQRRQAAGHSASLVAFPRPSEAHETPAIAAAAQAAAPIAAVALAGRAAELHAELQAEPTTNIIAMPETRERRFARALDLLARMKRGEPLTNDEALWLGGYQAGPEYRAMATIYEDFGEAALR